MPENNKNKWKGSLKRTHKDVKIREDTAQTPAIDVYRGKLAESYEC